MGKHDLIYYKTSFEAQQSQPAMAGTGIGWLRKKSVRPKIVKNTLRKGNTLVFINFMKNKIQGRIVSYL